MATTWVAIMVSGEIILEPVEGYSVSPSAFPIKEILKLSAPDKVSGNLLFVREACSA